MRYVILSVIFLMLGGCSGLSTIKTGSETVTEYAKDGSIVRQTQRELPLGDSQYDYQKTKRIVAAEASKAIVGKADAISDLAKTTMSHAQTNTEAVLVGVIASLSIADLDPNEMAKSLEAVGDRPMNGYEFGLGAFEKLTGIAWAVPVTVKFRQDGKTNRSYAKNAGQRIDVSGDGNSVSTKVTKTDLVTHNNTTGSNSPANTNVDQAASGCPDGNCGDSADDGEVLGNTCLNDPAITPEFLAAIPGNCSSIESYCAGRCSQKP